MVSNSLVPQRVLVQLLVQQMAGGKGELRGVEEAYEVSTCSSFQVDHAHAHVTAEVGHTCAMPQILPCHAHI